MTEEDLWDGYWVGSEVQRVVETARAGILGVATRLETALEEAVAAYWTNLNPDETEFFIEVVIKRVPASANLGRLDAILRYHLAAEPDLLDRFKRLSSQIKEVLEYRNLLVHRMRDEMVSYNRATDTAQVRRFTDTGARTAQEVSATRTERLAEAGSTALNDLRDIAIRLAVLGRAQVRELPWM